MVKLDTKDIFPLYILQNQNLNNLILVKENKTNNNERKRGGLEIFLLLNVDAMKK